MDFDEYSRESGFSRLDREYIDDIIQEKDHLISIQERDIDSLKREIESLKRELSYSKHKRK